MPPTLPERLVGPQGTAILNAYSDPRFVFTALTELEDLFVTMVKHKLQDFVVDGDLAEAPFVVPAYNPGDRKFDVIVAEAQLNGIVTQGLAYNRFEVEYQPDENADIEVYVGYAGDASYTMELFVRSTSRHRTVRIADWAVAALFDPLCQLLAGRGIQIPYNALRFSGKPQEYAGPDGMDKFWGIVLTIPGILIPWARMYRNDGPLIKEIKIDATPE